MRALLHPLRRASSSSIPFRRFCEEASFSRLNIYSDPTLAPKPLPDSEYPSWLWELCSAQPTKEELLRTVSRLYNKGGYDAIFDEIPEKDLRRLFRLHAKDSIKAQNASKAGGGVA